ncbi:MAG TPA: Lrp/AsnC family transcriptional regulator [Candidatus Dormibacteraeota bacterium]|jgi:DNA-binding Lrp family transcriptional regulator
MLVREAIDEQDRVLLRLLQRNARAPVAELAVAAGLAPSSVHERIRRLERRGVIRRWTVDVNPAAFGVPITAFVSVDAEAPTSELTPALRAVPGVEECHSVAGDPSFLLKVRVPDPDALLALVDELHALRGVTRTRTSVVLRTHFERGPEQER